LIFDFFQKKNIRIKMSSTSVLVVLLAAASAVSALFFEAGACSTEAITKARQPLIDSPAVGA
jgi:hypothetical protein